MNSSAPAPEVVGRLPKGVDYAVVKQICHAVPDLTVLAWQSFHFFRGWTYRAIDRELRRREKALQALPAQAVFEEHRRLTGLRQQLVTALTHLASVSPRSAKWIEARHVTAQRGQPEFRLCVWKSARAGPKTLDRRIVISEPRLMETGTVHWFAKIG